MKNLKVSGVDLMLKEIANENNSTPAEICEMISEKFNKPKRSNQREVPQGIGRNTVKLTSERTGKDIETLKQNLKSKGIEANVKTTLRSIADKLGVTPREIYILLSE